MNDEPKMSMTTAFRQRIFPRNFLLSSSKMNSDILKFSCEFINWKPFLCEIFSLKFSLLIFNCLISSVLHPFYRFFASLSKIQSPENTNQISMPSIVVSLACIDCLCECDRCACVFVCCAEMLSNWKNCRVWLSYNLCVYDFCIYESVCAFV